MREESQRLSQAEKTITKDKTQKDRTIKKLYEERKALRNKDVKSDREKIQYAELNKTVKKMRTFDLSLVNQYARSVTK